MTMTSDFLHDGDERAGMIRNDHAGRFSEALT